MRFFFVGFFLQPCKVSERRPHGSEMFFFPPFVRISNSESNVTECCSQCFWYPATAPPLQRRVSAPMRCTCVSWAPPPLWTAVSHPASDWAGTLRACGACLIIFVFHPHANRFLGQWSWSCFGGGGEEGPLLCCWRVHRKLRFLGFRINGRKN